jgi:hypothetical protein
MSELHLIVENDALKRQLERLHAEIAQLRVERDKANAKVFALLPQGTPEEEAEMLQLMADAVPFDLGGLIAEMEAERGQ